MTRHLVVHGHFYQPPRVDPFTGAMPADPTAAPAHDWNERIAADCYRPNAELGNLGAISWDLGPTLAGWMAGHDRVAHAGFVTGDRGVNGMAQPFHHSILPLAAEAERRTEIRWGLRDFAVRFGRPARGAWLPETAVDRVTLRLLADEGIRYTILAPWQVDGNGYADTRRPVRVDLGGGRSMIVALYDGLLSAAVSFEPDATVDADAFARDRLAPRFAEPGLDDDTDPIVIIATDGELYGHHQPFRELFLARLVGVAARDQGFVVDPLERAIDRAAAAGLPDATVRDGTSWSCHHGVGRWSTDCGCVPDGAWKAPLRRAFDRLAGAVDGLTEHLARRLPGEPDPWAARDAYVDVVLGMEPASSFARARLDAGATADEVVTFASVLEAQRWRLAMFASCAWFWENPVRIETAGALRAAARAARLIDDLAGTDLEARLVADLGLVIGPGGDDGATLLRSALAAVGQTMVVPGSVPGNPSARGLRATG